MRCLYHARHACWNEAVWYYVYPNKKIDARCDAHRVRPVPWLNWTELNNEIDLVKALI